MMTGWGVRMSIGPDWLTAACLAQEAILITVAASSGSVPRAAGAKMVVTHEQQFDTIGGGHLEHQAVALARRLLRQASDSVGLADPAEPGLPALPDLPHLQRIVLGASLGQCCGGVVHLLFERLDAAYRAQWQEAQTRWQAGHDSWRELALDGGQEPTRPRWFTHAPAHASQPGCHLWQDETGQRHLIDPVLAPRAHLLLFGAGHVAAHLIHQLAHLPCRIRWIDARADQFPASVPPHVSIEISGDVDNAADAQEAIATCPPKTTFLVMTHDHQLDQTLVEAVLRRNDALWLGLIGSSTKRARFEHRLRERGMSQAQLAQLACPIGLPGINSKQPAIIACSVAAQLLQIWQNAGQLDTP